MAMVTVERNGLVYSVTLSPRADACLQRWADQSGRNRANQLEDVVRSQLRSKLNEFAAMDGPTLVEKYNAMTAGQKAIVDPIFAAVVVPEPE